MMSCDAMGRSPFSQMLSVYHKEKASCRQIVLCDR